MIKVPNIARNTSYLTLALVIQKIISFSYFIILARYLGMEILGQYYTAMAFTTILALIIDLGFSNVLIREVAKDQAKTASWLQPILGWKIILALIAASIAYLVARLAGYDWLIIQLITISFVAMILDSLTNTFFSVMRGFHNLKYESLAAVAFQAIIFIGGYSMILAGKDARYLMLMMLLASFVNFLFSAVIARFKFRLNIWPKFEFKSAKLIFSLSWPFAVYNILQRLYSYLDSLLLGFLSTYVQVGLYQISFKIVFALQFLPLAFIASLYPAMSTYWQNNRQQLSITFQRALNYLIIVSLPIVFGVIVIAPDVIKLMKAEESAVWPLRVIMLALIFMFLNFPIGSLLNACDRQRRNTLNMGIVTVVSIILNLIFIPLWQALGASLTVLITSILMFILGIEATRSLVDYRFVKSWSVLFKSLGAAIVMALLVLLSRSLIGLYPAIFLGALSYFCLLYYLQAFKRADLMSIWQSFVKRSSSLN